MRILVTGSRSWVDRDTIYGALNDVVTEHGLWLKPDEYGNTLPTRDVIVVHGGAAGVDTIADDWAVNALLEPEVHKPDYGRWPGRLAPLKRNEHMVALGADLCLAFVLPCTSTGCTRSRPHGSHGAMHCASAAQRAGIPTRVITGGGGATCCDLHNSHCEPPSELCCQECTEANHPAHPVGVRCAWLGKTQDTNTGGAQ